MNFKNIIVRKEEGMGFIIFNRPKNLNALNKETLEELFEALKEFRKSNEVKVIFISGEGRAFVAGADIKYMSEITPEEGKEFVELGQKVFSFIEKIEKPVIAVVQGYALGGGTELILSCDLVYATEDSFFGQPEVKLGIIPGFGGTQRLPRLVGKLIAKEIIFTGDMIDAKKAKEIGMINEIFKKEEIWDKVKEIGRKIIQNGPLAVGKAKIAINEGYDLALQSGLEIEKIVFSELFRSKDKEEGIKAFIEKRKPEFRGE